ncbi:hypothetical protein BO99DRAFT_403400 [Aspergillus violaceofuscus CBS 115571]|uniref:Uncharacterized protein n=1 Tax=Aspergillus violaceofuscus (strain CBS 115571) TaxID=1450538 RepID=A0A2V5IFV2_ASPV1|nr:hypothetical protein BO99DRAFT_403400 [Aspergillus violaceofuscus CBS 115571]
MVNIWGQETRNNIRRTYRVKKAWRLFLLLIINLGALNLGNLAPPHKGSRLQRLNAAFPRLSPTLQDR